MILSFSGLDFLRALLLFIFLQGTLYLVFPKIIQSYAARYLVDAPLSSLRFIGVATLISGFFFKVFLEWLLKQ